MRSHHKVSFIQLLLFFSLYVITFCLLIITQVLSKWKFGPILIFLFMLHNIFMVLFILNVIDFYNTYFHKSVNHKDHHHRNESYNIEDTHDIDSFYLQSTFFW